MNALDDATIPAGPDWRLAAVCTSVDPEIFYPVNLDPTGAAVTAARQVCAACPARVACLLDVMSWEDPGRRWGVTAGLTPGERSALFTGQAVALDVSGAVAA